MSINGVSNSTSPAYTSSGAASNTNTKKSAEQSKDNTGVVYEPSNSTGSKGKAAVTDYSDVVKKMKGELSAKNVQLQNLVDQLLNKQATKYTSLSQLFLDVQSGKIKVDSSTVLQAQKDVADDGYWGAEKTSDRLVSMAQALSGGDATKADTMISAIKKGYDQASKAWGGKLPDICQKTIDLATQKLDSWRNSMNASTEETE